MPDISTELNNIKNARYGKDVRQSIYDGIKKVNDNLEDVGVDELLDIRVGYNSITYSSAGNAVRKQFGDISPIIYDNHCVLPPVESVYSRAGYLDEYGNFQELENDIWHCTDYISVSEDEDYIIDGTLPNADSGLPIVAAYNVNKIFISIAYLATGSTITVDNIPLELPLGTKYIVCLSSSNNTRVGNFYKIYRKEKKRDPIDYENLLDRVLFYPTDFGIFSSDSFIRYVDKETISFSGVTADSGVQTPRFSGNGKVIISYTSNYVTRFWVKVFKNDGTSSLRLLKYDIPANEEYSTSIDLDYYAVYFDMKEISIIINGGTGSPVTNCNIHFSHPIFLSTISDVDGYSPFFKTFITNIASKNISGESGENERDYLVSPNGTRYHIKVQNDGSVKAIPVIPNKILFIGNSLLVGNGFGMNASDNTNDYCYHVKNITGASGTRVGANAYEDCTSESAEDNWINSNLFDKVGSDVDLVLIQLGDNVNTPAKRNVFLNTGVKKLIDYVRSNCPNAYVAWVGTWYSRDLVDDIEKLSTFYGAKFISITDLVVSDNRSYVGAVINYGTPTTRTYEISSYSTDDNNITINFIVSGQTYSATFPYTNISEVSETSITVTGNYQATNSAGVASHPGNDGMSAIAKRICHELGILLIE